ncbi:methyl-accepting chemotaxis protein [Terrarubrum flagellatum]|uniref:methyl-accepting chemotaxis protein n=1 Tax=Terrirubrum flagellatum TaxID=2895980 RepID=UPI003144FC3A
MEKKYLSDSDRYALYGLNDAGVLAMLDAIARGGLAFVAEGVDDFMGTIVSAPVIGDSYRRHGPMIASALKAHFETIISPAFVERHGESLRAVVKALSDGETDMRALYSSASYLMTAYARRRSTRWGLPRRAAPREMAVLQRVFMCTVATALTHQQTELIAENSDRRERLSLQLADFRGVVEGVSGELGQAASLVDRALAAVASAARQALERSRSAAGATELSNANLTSSAASTEELAISINELARQSELGRNVVARVERAVGSGNAAIQELDVSARTIGSIVDLISQIAEQTNLLSLNATIEAARAGEAGRGFAVVAQEVKALASQTTKATQDIVDQITAVQSATARSVNEIAAIGGAMEDMSRNAAEVAAAISQQNGLTGDLSRNLHETVSQVMSANEGYGAAVDLIESAGAEAEKLRSAVAQLSRIGSELVGDVEAFATRIKAA